MTGIKITVAAICKICGKCGTFYSIFVVVVKGEAEQSDRET